MFKNTRTALAVSLIGFVTVSSCVAPSAVSCPAATEPGPTPESAQSFASVVNKVLPAVVYIYVQTDKTDSEGNTASGVGSGVILRSDGWIITNKHVVDGFKEVEVTLYDRRKYSPTKVLMDDVADLAVLKIQEQGLPALSMGNPDSINVGDWVIAVGHALGISPSEGGPTVTEGIVSSLGRSFTMNDVPYYDLVQTSAAINPGNSGGALVNLSGEIIGVNSAGVISAQGIGYAIGVGTARHIFDDMVQYGKPRHPYLGVRILDLTAEAAHKLNMPLEGARVQYVEPGSPAEAAGLRTDDVIVSMGGMKVESAADVVKVLWRHEPGDSTSMVYLHRGLEVTKDLRLAERPQTDSI